MKSVSLGSVVGQRVEHRLGRGVGRGARGTGEHREQCRVRFARPERHRTARDAAGLVVEHDGGAESGRSLPHERLRAQQTVLLAVGQQNDQVVADRAVGRQCTGGLEHGGDAQAVVPGTRRAGHGVVVRDEEHGAGRPGSGQGGDHVRDRPDRLDAGGSAVGRTDGPLYLGDPALCGELGDQVLPAGGVSG